MFKTFVISCTCFLKALMIFLLSVFGYENHGYSAMQKISLLTALEEELPIDLSVLESILKKQFDAYPYELEVTHKATQYNLWQALHSYHTIALFWLSHAGCTEYPVPQYAVQVVMPDFNHFDATKVLQEIHPNLRFLGIIACNSNLVVNKVNNEYSIRISNPDLEIKSFSQKISPEDGLLQAMKIAHDVVRNEEFQKGYTVRSCPSYNGYPILIKRSVPKNEIGAFFPPLRVETNGGKILGFFKAQDSHSYAEENIEIFFPLSSSLKRTHLDLIIETGRMVSSPFALYHGHIEIVSSWNGAGWRIIPILQGITTKILSYDGTSNLSGLSHQQVKYLPFDCSPMPPIKDSF
jgi:hypothetical protein